MVLSLLLSARTVELIFLSLYNLTISNLSPETIRAVTSRGSPLTYESNRHLAIDSLLRQRLHLA